ncbi:hypothetical protein BKE38_08695 [Pseudoroseomonas deserti]|uniref:Uncharacterized protein n=1 Tax=Teichococcus deserti TaxID=1817963 RepID=A0A1V2H3Z3_9PROT|nr:hypothetical protein BKE38_08695 [Pseudoroseomonas deserti]
MHSGLDGQCLDFCTDGAGFQLGGMLGEHCLCCCKLLLQMPGLLGPLEEVALESLDLSIAMTLAGI